MDLSLWLLKDEEDEHIFTIPSNTIISPNQYIVFCKDTASFIVLFPELDNYYGDLGFGLGGGDKDASTTEPKYVPKVYSANDSVAYFC